MEANLFTDNALHNLNDDEPLLFFANPLHLLEKTNKRVAARILNLKTTRLTNYLTRTLLSN